MCWTLGVLCCVLLYYRYALVLWCALRRVWHFSAVRYAAWLCCAMCAFVLSSLCVAALCELLVRRAGREALLCAALPYCAVLCSAVHWNREK